MGVKGLACSKCEAELVEETITKDGKEVQVAKCTTGCGKITAPTCCGQAMECCNKDS